MRVKVSLKHEIKRRVRNLEKGAHETMSNQVSCMEIKVTQKRKVLPSSFVGGDNFPIQESGTTSDSLVLISGGKPGVRERSSNPLSRRKDYSE